MGLLGKIITRESSKTDTVDFYAGIREDREYAARCGYDPGSLHCAGCPHSCPVDDVKCSKGRRLREAFDALENN